LISQGILDKKKSEMPGVFPSVARALIHPYMNLVWTGKSGGCMGLTRRPCLHSAEVHELIKKEYIIDATIIISNLHKLCI